MSPKRFFVKTSTVFLLAAVCSALLALFLVIKDIESYTEKLKKEWKKERTGSRMEKYLMPHAVCKKPCAANRQKPDTINRL